MLRAGTRVDGDTMADRREDSNVFFELGVASALNQPTLLFIAPDYPIDRVPPSGTPYM
jgi:hypothetical protein